MADAYLFTQLRKLNLFDGINGDDLVSIIDKQNIKIEDIKSGTTVFTAGDEYNKLIILLSGKLAAVMHGAQGKTLIVEYLEAVCSIAAPILFSSRNTLPVSLIAEQDGQIIALSKEVILKLCSEFPAFLEHLLTDTGSRVSFLTEKIRMFQFNTIRQKVVSHILSLQREQNTNNVTLFYTKEKLAELMGVTRPALSREFSLLVKDNLIESSGKMVLIKDVKILKGIIEE